jgi:trehalose-phosphatase
MRAALAACAARADTEVAIVSGRALADVRVRIHVPGLSYAGNHGLEIEGPGIEPFVHPDLPHFAQRSLELARALGEIAEPGVWVEEKGASLTVHYRQADPAFHAAVAERAREIVREAGFQARDAICAVEARPPIGWDKGRAVFHLLRARHGPAWSEHLRVVYVGDDDTDEDAFRVLLGLGVTFRVGRAERSTLASRRLPNLDAVETLLDWLAKRPLPRSGV